MSTQLVYGEGQTVPTVFLDIVDFTLSDPGTDYEIGVTRLEKGVFFKPVTAGAYRCVTHYQYMDNGGNAYTGPNGPATTVQRDAVIAAAVAAGDYVDMQLAAYQWSDCTVVFIDASSSVGTVLNIGHF